MWFIVKPCPGYFCRKNYLSTQMLLRCINICSSGSRKRQERICLPSARSQNCSLETSSPCLEKTSAVPVTDWYLCPYWFSCPALATLLDAALNSSAVQGKWLLRVYWQGIRIGTGLDWGLCAMDWDRELWANPGEWSLFFPLMPEKEGHQELHTHSWDCPWSVPEESWEFLSDL